MKKLLLAILPLWLFLPLTSPAHAQCNGAFGDGVVCGNSTGSSNIPGPTIPSALPIVAFGTTCPPTAGIGKYGSFANTTNSPTGTTLNFYDTTQCVQWATLNQTAHQFYLTIGGVVAPPVLGNIDITDNQQTKIRMTSYGGSSPITALVPYFQFQTAGGTQSSPSYLQNSDNIGHLDWWGWTGNNPNHDGSNFYPAARVQALANENWTSTHQGASIFFSTTHAGASQPILTTDFAMINGALAVFNNQTSVTSPPIVGDQDMTTGINFPSAGSVGLVGNATQILTVSNASVTINPATGALLKLSANGTGQGLFAFDGSSDQLFGLTRDASNRANLFGFSGVCLGQGTSSTSTCQLTATSSGLTFPDSSTVTASGMSGATINNTTIGTTTPSSGIFTTLSATLTLSLSSTSVLTFNSDTGISRDSAAVIDFGNGTQGSSIATLQMSSFILGGTPQFQQFSTGASTQTFTNSPCSALTTERWLKVKIVGSTSQFFVPACS